MIGSLTGTITLQKNALLITVQGVGYVVSVTQSLFQNLALHLDTKHTLIIYTHVKEDQLALFGFKTESEKEVFMLLLSVSGVGPQTALNIMNNPPNDIITAVQEADVAFFTRTPRVGKKLAQKIIIELRSKLGELKELSLAPETSQTTDFKAALEGLGFDETEIATALKAIDLESTSLEAAIKQALTLS